MGRPFLCHAATVSKALKKVIDRLHNASIPYMLTGSMAMNFYGHPRATNDFDIVIEIQKQNSERIFNLFKRVVRATLTAEKSL